jgi:hypothetical protein
MRVRDFTCFGMTTVLAAAAASAAEAVEWVSIRGVELAVVGDEAEAMAATATAAVAAAVLRLDASEDDKEDEEDEDTAAAINNVSRPWGSTPCCNS